MIDIEELLLMIENKQVELEYNSSFTDKEDLNKKKSQIEILDWLAEEIKKWINKDKRMENLLYIEFQKLNLFKESENIENGYNLSLEQALKKTVNNDYNDILVDYESSDYNIFIEIYKILSNNKVMNLILKVLIFLIIGLFGLSFSGVFYFIYFMLRLIFV